LIPWMACSVMVMAGLGEPADDTWPQWRGPTGDSVAAGRSLPTHWSRTENVVWKVALPGRGNSTPAIWKDAVFVTTQQDERVLLLLRLDRGTGKVVWQREVGQGTPRRTGPVGNGRFHEEHNMASPSPITDGRRVWVHFGNGDLACYDFDGRQVWKINLVEKHGPFSIWWGHANSPVIVGDLLISICVQDPKGGGKSYVVAHDKETGQERWLTPRITGATSEPGDSYTTPLVYRRNGRVEVIVFGGNVLDAYDPTDGRRLWQCQAFQGNRVISGPTLAGDTVFAVEGMRGKLLAVKVGGEVLWKYAGSTPDAPTPVAVNGLVFLATNAGVAVCLDAATGQEVWKERLGNGFRATPLVSGNKVYYLTLQGRTVIVEAARQFKVVARNDLDEETHASPAAAGGDLFIRTRLHLYRIGSGKKAGP